jgi:tripartite-type tricarboxylate transporter receptor subunit TctC
VVTPPSTIAKLQQGTAQAVAAPDLRERFMATGLTPVGSTSNELAARITADSAKWTNVIGSLRRNEVK